MNMELVYKQLDELLQMGRIEETEDFLILPWGGHSRRAIITV